VGGDTDKTKNKNRREKRKRERVGEQLMVLMTSRDEAMLHWLQVVRFADSDAIRWALPAIETGHAVEPVHFRRSQHWIQRMAELGLIGRDRLTMHSNYIVWASTMVTGRRGPNLFGQTMRHELAVAYTSARYLAQGYEWVRDQRPRSAYDHQADGIATRDGTLEYIEVELTPKSNERYWHILGRHGDRLQANDNARVTYLCTADAARIINREANRLLILRLRARFTATTMFDQHGKWIPPMHISDPVNGGGEPG
jgi:hypothetical protein